MKYIRGRREDNGETETVKVREERRGKNQEGRKADEGEGKSGAEEG